MITILTWISFITGGLLIILLLLSLLGGLELDFDLGGDTDVETDSGGLGVVKSVLTFISIASWVVKLVLLTDRNPAMAFGIGIVSGLAAVFFLSLLLRALLRNQENVNWKPQDATYEKAHVYLRIKKNELGLIKVNINGAIRELKARSHGEDIATGAQVVVDSVDDEGIALVSLSNS